MNHKFNYIFLITVFTAFNLVAQSSLKGNKIVVTKSREISNFTAIEIMSDVDVYLFQGSTTFLSVDADENLHEAIQTKVEGSTLKIYLSNKIKSNKKLNVLITVTDSLQSISARANSNIYADSRLILRAFTLNTYDNADATLKIDADNLVINGFKNSDLKLDVFSVNTVVNINESCELKIEGEIENLSADIKNNSVLSVKGKGKILTVNAMNNGSFKGSSFEVDETTLDVSSRTDVSVNSKDKLTISATGTAEIISYGKPAIELAKFEEKAKLHKK